MEVLLNIRKNYTSFSKANKKIADYVLRSPRKVIKMTASEIGETSGVSPATVVRFVKKIGFSSLEEMKVQLASEQIVKRSGDEIDPIVLKDDSLEKLCGKVEALIKETTSDVFDLINQKILQDAINAVKSAQNIYLFGIGASSLTAYDLFHKFNRAGRRASFVFDTHIGIEMLSYASPEDIVIAITYSGHTKEILLACEYARQKRVHLIIITCNESEKIKELANEVLLVPANEHLLRVGAISSMYASMFIGTVLYLGVIQENIEDDIEENMIMTKKMVSPLKEE